MKKFDFYKCNETNMLVEIFKESDNDNSDCLKGMELVEVKNADSTVEKHVPYIEEIDEGYFVSVGKETKHPMTEGHYIEFIELTVDERKYRHYLLPTDEPVAKFVVEKGKQVSAREYCNLHGLWYGN